ncbi:hypothetical protein MJO29_006360 [Puccinia striiformis f. sp. tritici]|nr:hypothetical protein MJO29_006360 [Puccinia striiformis f. sp. tritici]
MAANDRRVKLFSLSGPSSLPRPLFPTAPFIVMQNLNRLHAVSVGRSHHSLDAPPPNRPPTLLDRFTKRLHRTRT